MSERLDDRVPVRRLLVHIGLGENMKPLAWTYAAGENVKLWVIPGRLAIIERKNAAGAAEIMEVPIGQLGWSYEPIKQSS